MTLATDKALLHGGLGVQDVTELLGREKSQVSRTLQILAEYGLVDRHPDTRAYQLGWRTYTLGLLAGEKRLLDAARPLLARLVTAAGERAHLSVLQGANVLTVLSEAPPHALQAVDWVGRAVPAYCTSTARALMFDYPKIDVERLFQNTSLRPLGPNTISGIDELWARLEVDQARGFAVADAEFEPGLVAVAAPVREAGGRIIAAINVSGPFEAGLEWTVDLDQAADFIGKEALKHFYSPRLRKNVGFALVPVKKSGLGKKLNVRQASGDVVATVIEKPFIDPRKVTPKS